jgi:hypothetical protein
MVKRALVITLSLLVFYAAFVVIFQKKITRTGQNQYDRNVVKAEEYLFEDGQQADVLILGSSMASRLVVDSLPGDYFNLAMAGMSIFDGLSLLEKSARKPKVVVIETNVVLRDLNEDLRRDLFDPVTYASKKYIPFLRKKYQPVAVLKALMRDGIGVKQDAALFKPPKHIFDQEVAGVMKNNANTPDETLVKRKFEELQKGVRKLESDKIHVVFFEMPFYNEAENLAEPTILRANFQTYFPSSAYDYIVNPEDEYETTDGVHLGGSEAIRYTHYFRQQLASYIAATGH